MTELEMASVLGLLLEPAQNRVDEDALFFLDLSSSKSTFGDLAEQKRIWGPVNKDLWTELLPWHSLN